MEQNKESLPGQYFDDVYKNSSDPWQFETSPYEREKYKTTIDALPGCYRNAFEIGCSIGVLTKMLLQKAGKILAVDPSGLALEKAASRLKNNPNVVFQQMLVPKDFPFEKFDLIVLSEVGYYLNMDDLALLAKKATDRLTHQGHLIAVHWTPFVRDYPLTGDQVHDYLLSLCGPGKPFKHMANQRKEKYRLDLFEKN